MSISSETRRAWLAGHVPKDLASPKPWLTAPDGCRGQARLEQAVEVADRAQLEARLGREIENSRATGEDFVLVVLDLDELSRLNDEHGCQKGNEALLLVALVLEGRAREADMIAHFGGDEFAALILNSSLVRAREFFEEIRAEVAERSERDLGVTVRLSAGAVKPLDYVGDTGDLL